MVFDNKVKVSVIIPVYNTAQYIPRCLDSVLKNSYRNLEILCINDGSRDNSLSVLQEYADKDSRVVIVNQKNAGVSAARNTGMDMATGAFLAFIDSDDWIHPQYFELLLRVQQEHCADCVVCGVEITEKEHDVQCINAGSVGASATDLHAVMKDKFGRTNIWGRIYKKDLVEKSRFPVGIKIAEDTVFNLDVLCQKEDAVIVGVSEKLYYYFQRSDSAVHSVSNALVHQAIPYYLEIHEKTRGKKGNIYVVEQILKTTLAYRYLSMFRPEYKRIKEECKIWIRTCMKHLSRFEFKKRISFFILIKSPFLYRIYRISNDKSMLMWERNERHKRLVQDGINR